MRISIITFFTLLLFSFSTFAQGSNDNYKNKKNTLKYGYGSTFHSNEMVGNFQYGEYTRFFGKRVALGALGGYIKSERALADGQVDLAFNAWKGDLNLYLLPFNGEKTSLKIGGGGSYWMGEFKSRDSLEVDFTVVDEENHGWNVAAEFEVYIANTLVLGSRAAFTKSNNGEEYYFFGLNAGLKF